MDIATALSGWRHVLTERPSVLALVAAAILLLALFAWLGRTKGPPPVEGKPLLTASELRFFSTLREALPRHHVCCQTAMGALLRPKRGLSRDDYVKARNRFSQKIVDFLVIDPDSGEVVAIVELDDRTHDTRKDAIRDAMTAQGGYATVRVPNHPRPTVDSIRTAFAGLV